MVEQYVEKLKFQFERVAWYSHYINKDQAERLITSYEALPVDRRLHFFLSPAVFELVSRSQADSVAVLTDLCESEVLIANGRLAEGLTGVWSAMGDECLHRETDGVVRTTATKLDSIITVDFDSPQALRISEKSPIMCQPPVPLSDRDRDIVVNKLQDALEYVDTVAPTLGRLIRNYTRAIRIRAASDNSAFASEHITDTVGEVRYLNPQTERITVQRLAEALIHESVHNLLSTYEYLEGQFVLGGASLKYRPVSPWSGNPIPVASFIHAVLVWFTLFHFSLRELKYAGLDSEMRMEILRRRNHYASGFLVPARLSEYIRDLAYFNEKGILTTIDEVQRLVNTKVREALLDLATA